MQIDNSYFRPVSKHARQRNAAKKPDPFKNKSPDLIVNEFKANTLPKLRLRRLIKLQAVMRGYHTRKFKIPRKKMDFQIMRNYVDRIMKNFMEVTPSRAS